MFWMFYFDSFLFSGSALSLSLGYVGPAPVYTAIGAIIALILSIVGAILAIVLWPLRRWLKRRKTARIELSDEAAKKSQETLEDATHS